MSAGTINSFVLGSGMSLIGTMSKYTRSTGWDSLVINDLTILEGGILDGFATGRGNDGYSQIQKGTYVYADGTVRNWSFGGGTASGLVINSGCFVIQGPTVVSGVETETAGVTKDLYIDGGILVVAGSSVNDGITVVNDAALQVYGASTITNGVNLDFAEGDQFYNFSVVDGLATNLYITNGGFYYSSEGTTIENSIITGQRDTASGNADYANSVLWVGNSGTARNVELQSGAVLKLNGNFTLDNVTIGEGVRIEWTSPTAGFTLIDTVLPGYENVKFEDGYLENWYVNGGTFTFQDQSQMKYKNIVIENLDYNGLKASGTIYVDGMVFDGGSSSFGNNFNAEYGSVMKNVTWHGGWSDFKNDINGLFINVTNPTPVDINLTAQLTPVKDGIMLTDKIVQIGSETEAASQVIIPGNVTDYRICIHQITDEAGIEADRIVSVPGLNRLIEKIPDEIRMEPVETTAVQEFKEIELGGDYRIETDYQLETPLQFNEGTEVIYSEKMDGWGSDMEDYDFKEVVVSMKATNAIPLDLQMTADAIDVEGNILSEVSATVEGNITAGTPNQKTNSELKIILKSSSTEALHRLDGLTYRVSAKTTKEVAGTVLNENQTLKLDDIRIQISRISLQFFPEADIGIFQDAQTPQV